MYNIRVIQRQAGKIAIPASNLVKKIPKYMISTQNFPLNTIVQVEFT